MCRLPGDATEPVLNAGPDDQRYGAWARTVPAGGRVRFRLDDTFAARLDGADVAIRIVYLDDHSGEFRLEAGGQSHAVKMHGSNRWQIAEFGVPDSSLLKMEAEAHLGITMNEPLTLHMVEVVRAE